MFSLQVCPAWGPFILKTPSSDRRWELHVFPHVTTHCWSVIQVSLTDPLGQTGVKQHGIISVCKYVWFYFRTIWFRVGESPQNLEFNRLMWVQVYWILNAQVPPQRGSSALSVLTLWSYTVLQWETSRSKAFLEGSVIPHCYKMEYKKIWCSRLGIL